MHSAMRCRFCEYPSCTNSEPTDIRGIMRRVAVGNFVGARKVWAKTPVDASKLAEYESNCICAREEDAPVEICKVIAYLDEVKK